MYIQGWMFLIAIPKTIKFIIIQDIKESSIPLLNKSLDDAFLIYNQARLKTQMIHMYHEFKPIEYTFKYIDITINCTAA